MAHSVTVIKIGGDVVGDAARLAAFAAELRARTGRGERIVVVHGGGEQVSSLCRRLGFEPEIVNGRRVTDARVLEALVMALAGSVNTAVLAALRVAGVRSAGVSGVDAGLLAVEKRRVALLIDDATGRAREVDYGYFGTVTSVDAAVLVTLLEAGVTPVVAPLGADEQGVVYNVNADTVASALAVALGARRLMIVTGAGGVRGADGARIPVLTPVEAKRLLESGIARDGMVPKLEAAIEAVEGGVGEVLIGCLQPEAEGTAIRPK